jgi:riboflavin kinase/FMN adenylyltransferase
VKVIRLKYPHDLQKEQFSPMVMALGYFDGVHLGHQKVIKKAKEIAKENGLKSAVMTFDPHPSVVLRKSIQHVEYITPLHEKERLIADLDIDYLFIVQFTSEFANLLPQEFVDHYIIGLNVVHVVAGFDYTYGRMGKGTMETLPFHSRELFDFTIVPKLECEREKISSTLIRSKIREGKTNELPHLLGRFYTTSGIVIHGDKRGRQLGFPTANVDVFGEFLLPPPGVYSVRILVEGFWHEAVCNVGYKPTFNEENSQKLSVEVHIFDYEKDIYGQKVMVEWHEHLRKERKFSGVNELIEQIEKDKQSAIFYFKNSSVNKHCS